MPGGLLDQTDNGALERAASRFLGRARKKAVAALAAVVLKDGVVQSPEIRFLNFIGAFDVVYDRENRAVNIINHGAPVATSATTVVSNTTAKVQNVSPTTDDADTDFPGWKLASYTPTGWAAAVVATHAPAQDPFIPTGASTLWDTASRPNTDPAQKLLVRQSFTLPAGTVTAATLEFFADAWGDIWLNGTSYGTAGAVGGAGSGALGTVSVAFSDLVLGGTNVLAVQGQDIARSSSAHDRSTAFRLVVTYSVAGVDTRYALTGDVITDHGALSGLGDDDHPQYLTQAEGDARYDPLGGSGTTTLDSLTDVTIATPATGQTLRKSAGDWINSDDLKGLTIELHGAATLVTGVVGYWEAPFAGQFTSWRVVSDASLSIVFDLWRDTYANFPPTVADTITASAKPTLSSATKNENTTLTGWTVAFSKGDWLVFNVDSVTPGSATLCTLSLGVKRTA